MTHTAVNIIAVDTDLERRLEEVCNTRGPTSPQPTNPEQNEALNEASGLTSRGVVTGIDCEFHYRAHYATEPSQASLKQ